MSRGSLSRFIFRILFFLVIIPIIIASINIFVKDDSTKALVSSLLSVYPFGKLISDIIGKTMKFTVSVPVMTFYTVFEDIVRLAVSTLILTFITPLLIRIFNPITLSGESITHSIDQAEIYMNTPGYRIRAFIITLVASPVALVITNYIISAVYKRIMDLTGSQGIRFFMNVIIVAILVILSIAFFRARRVLGLFRSTLWIIARFLFSMLRTLVINIVTIAMALAILNNKLESILPEFIALIILLAVFDFVRQTFQRILYDWK